MVVEIEVVVMEFTGRLVLGAQVKKESEGVKVAAKMYFKRVKLVAKIYSKGVNLVVKMGSLEEVARVLVLI